METEVGKIASLLKTTSRKRRFRSIWISLVKVVDLDPCILWYFIRNQYLRGDKIGDAFLLQ